MKVHECGIRFLQKIGLYLPARALYQRLHPERRRTRAALRGFYRQFVDPGDLCFDVGANVGQTAEAMLSIGARVVSVEPNPLCADLLKQRFGRNKRFQLVASALGAVPGNARLHFEGTASTASLRSDWHLAGTNEIEVPVTTLAELIRRFGVPKFLKVDVEGFEVEVFRGLDATVPIIYFEYHRDEFDRARQVLHRLREIGSVAAINIIDNDHQKWLLPEWVDFDHFEHPEIHDKLHKLGNIVVRMTAARVPSSV